jgi:hypothetical protein
MKEEHAKEVGKLKEEL